jgi:UDPglucose 6-dehydrogenase
MKVTIIGAGYVGLVTGACLASRGCEVICVDRDESKLRLIESGRSPIHEVGLDALLEQTVGRTFTVTSDLASAVQAADVILIAVGTPSTDRGIDLGAVRGASEEIGRAMAGTDRYQIVAVKSTVVPGTTDTVVAPIVEQASGKRLGADFGIGANPEFLTEGQAVADFMHPDRIVIGGYDERTLDGLAKLYASFDGVDVVRVNTRTAEMIKYASNAMLALQISFANELAELATAVGGIDIVDVMKGVHLSNYLRPEASAAGRVMAPLASFLEAGCGFGGSCLPKDVTALARHGEAQGCDMSLLQAVLHRNRRQSHEVVRLLQQALGTLAGRRITVLGLAFKPDTDDVRESPAFPVIRQLVDAGASVRAFDPVAIDTARAALNGTPLDYAASLRDAVQGAEGIAIVTRWREFLELPALLTELGESPVVVDGRRMLDKRTIGRYAGIGLG